MVTHLSGPLPDEANILLSPPGHRGVMEQTLEPGTYYVNPYLTRVNLVDCRSHRLNLAEGKNLGFPSKDGFWVSLDGIIEFRVKPERAAGVFVLYNEDENGERIDDEIVRKVVLPNARSFCRLEGSKSLGRELIQGETRTAFQDNFQQKMRTACESLGIEIIQALITQIRPPEKIASPVRDREIAKQKKSQYEHQIVQQESEKQLAIEQELITQKQALVQAEQEVVQVTTQALRDQEVAVTKSKERLAVAEFKLQAARDQAAMVLATGKAAAEVVRFDNEAEAVGWQRSVEAFEGDGATFARYVLMKKLAPAFRRIMTNSADSPLMRIFDEFTPSPAAATSH